jgi:hypothetical protein
MMPSQKGKMRNTNIKQYIVVVAYHEEFVSGFSFGAWYGDATSWLYATYRGFSRVCYLRRNFGRPEAEFKEDRCSGVKLLCN